MTSKELLDELAPSKENTDSGTEKDSSKSNSEIEELNENQLKVLQDLNWLLREGAVIAFGDGKIELATPKNPGASKTEDEPKEKID
ncbi:MAG: hypothetical protein VYA85_08645 [Verrucomicrobiota bacterium]|nr:hypothetical protein [Verrucomicrobiota bacterium]